MGLGLTITKLIVELMGGAIGVTSEPSKGSDFHFSISLQENDPSLLLGPSEEPQFRPTSALELEEDLMPIENSERVSPTIQEAVIQRTLTKEHNTRLFSPDVLVAASLPTRSSFSVLIVDDNPFNIMVTQALLQQMTELELDIDSCLHGQLALDKITQRHRDESKRPYDVIFLDLHMPVLDGI
jgi:PleD family two-component response regulator